jgi:hypothetical protein
MATTKTLKTNDDTIEIKNYIRGNVFKLKNGCWMWLGKAREDGYGSARCCGYKCKAHQLSYLAFKGEIPGDKVIRHVGCSQKNTLCVNPDHLELGTVWQNGIDKIKDKTMKRGEDHPSTKLTELKVIEIYKLKDTNQASADTVANLFGTTRQNVLSIWRRRTWAHLHYSEEELKFGNMNRFESYAKNQVNIINRKVTGFTLDEYYKFFQRIFADADIQQTETPLETMGINTPCLIPAAAKRMKTKSYVKTRIGGVTRYAHVIMWELFKNNCQLKQAKDSDGNILHIRHLCNNRACCNVYHLQLGTVKENCQDVLLNPSKRAKLTVQNIKYIRTNDLNETDISELAKKLQVTTNHIKRIKNNQCWKFVTV